MVSLSCWCKDSFSWEPTAGEAGEPDFVVLSRKWANGGMGWMLIATVWIGSFPHSLLTRKQIAWKAENWEAWSATYDFSSLKPVLSFTTSRGSRNDMAKEKTQTAALGVQTYMFATPIRACFLQPSNIYILYCTSKARQGRLKVASKQDDGFTSEEKHQRQLGCPNQGHAASASIPPSPGIAMSRRGVHSGTVWGCIPVTKWFLTRQQTIGSWDISHLSISIYNYSSSWCVGLTK
jgi:hypothetical protein